MPESSYFNNLLNNNCTNAELEQLKSNEQERAMLLKEVKEFSEGASYSNCEMLRPMINHGKKHSQLYQVLRGNKVSGFLCCCPTYDDIAQGFFDRYEHVKTQLNKVGERQRLMST